MLVFASIAHISGSCHDTAPLNALFISPTYTLNTHLINCRAQAITLEDAAFATEDSVELNIDTWVCSELGYVDFNSSCFQPLHQLLDLLCNFIAHNLVTRNSTV